jgi:hypothetical protein
MKFAVATICALALMLSAHAQMGGTGVPARPMGASGRSSVSRVGPVRPMPAPSNRVGMPRGPVPGIASAPLVARRHGIIVTLAPFVPFFDNGFFNPFFNNGFFFRRGFFTSTFCFRNPFFCRKLFLRAFFGFGSFDRFPIGAFPVFGVCAPGDGSGNSGHNRNAAGGRSSRGVAAGLARRTAAPGGTGTVSCRFACSQGDRPAASEGTHGKCIDATDCLATNIGLKSKRGNPLPTYRVIQHYTSNRGRPALGLLVYLIQKRLRIRRAVSVKRVIRIWFLITTPAGISPQQSFLDSRAAAALRDGHFIAMCFDFWQNCR